jgi:transcriptional repressor NrdR
MRCPYCKVDDDRVVNSRTTGNGAAVKRRRECNECGRRYTTYERMEETPLRVIKKDGNRENFSRQKLLDGLARACHKRPISTDRLEEVADEIERELNQRFENEVPSEAIGELVMEKLRQLDQVAFIRFASVYREFKDVSDFLEEAEVLEEEREHTEQ